MKNLINWMCLISMMGLVLQIMIHMNKEVIRDFNKSNIKRKKVVRKNESVANTRVKQTVNCYQEKIAK